VTKAVHCKREPYDVYIGRPSKFGNPFKLTPAESREQAVAKYFRWLLAQAQAALREAARRELRGKVLGCWCAPKQCHGDALATVADSSSDRELLEAVAHKEST
jgi:hypothetical protein